MICAYYGKVYEGMAHDPILLTNNATMALSSLRLSSVFPCLTCTDQAFHWGLSLLWTEGGSGYIQSWRGTLTCQNNTASSVLSWVPLSSSRRGLSFLSPSMTLLSSKSPSWSAVGDPSSTNFLRLGLGREQWAE